MRILFTTYAARPHLYPLVPLAWACLAAGHEVRMVSTPGLADAVAGTGLPAATVGTDIDANAWYSRGVFIPRKQNQDESDDDAWKRVTVQLAHKQFSVAEAMTDDLIEFARSWRPDLIVHDPVTFAGAVAGAVLNIPTATHLYGMVRHLRLEIVDLVGHQPHDGYVELFAKRGVDARIEPGLWIDPCPPSLRWPGQHDYVRRQARYIPYNGPGEVPAALSVPSNRPRVCATWGTSQQKKMGASVIKLFGDIVRAIAELDVEVLLTIGATDPADLHHIGDLPANVTPIEWVPLGMLMAGCQAIVHTGGTGVMMTAAAHGVPQLGITKIPEGEFNVERLVAVGAGRQLDQDLVTPELLRQHVAQLLTNASYQRAATRLRADIERQPVPSSLMPALTELVDTGQPIPV